MRSLSGVLLAMVLGLPFASPALGQLRVNGWDLGVTETLYVDWHRDYEVLDPDGYDAYEPATEDFLDVKNRLNLDASNDWLVLGMRLDSASFFSLHEDDALEREFEKRYVGDLTVEKMFVRGHRAGYELTLGDFYVCLGKGIALCVRKVDEVAVDTTLRGGKAVLNTPVLGMTAAAGFTNVVNVGDQVEEKLPDPQDLVAAFEARVTPFRWLELSGHTSTIRDFEEFHKDTIYGRDQITVTGPMVRIPDLWGALSFTAEYDYLTARNIIYTVKDSNVRFKEDEVEGQAAYASLLGSWWIFSVLGEMKWYEGFDGAGFVGKTVSSSAGPEFKEEIQYGVLPPLEDEGLFIPPPYYDVFGGRVRVSGTIPRLGSTWWVTYARFQGLEEQTSPDDNTYVKHVYFGVEQRVDSLSIVGNLSGGQREEKVGLDHDYLMRHAAGDVQFPLFGPHSLALVGRVEMYDDSLSRPGEFTISRLSTTYSFAPLASLSGTWEHDGQPKSSTVAGDREDFFSGELTVRLKSDTFAKLFVGASRGGLRCAGGQCRTFPPFDGVRAELTVRF